MITVMNTSKERLTQLFNLYFDHTATQQEIDEFNKLICDSANDEYLSSLLIDLWEDSAKRKPLFPPEKSENILNAILSPKPQRQQHDPQNPTDKFSYWLKIAAAVILMISGFLYFNQKQPASVVKTVKHSEKQDILPGGNHATLTLSNGERIKLDNAPNGILIKKTGVQIVKTTNGQLIVNLTAVTSKRDDAQNVISTPKGGQYEILLSDGTKVWLNAASSLRFPLNFKQQFRKVELTGEGYFEVAKNPASPFIVQTASAAIKVFGTHFNVTAYSDEIISKTTLLEGRISVHTAGDSALMKPGEQAILKNGGHIAIHDHINEKSIMAWKNGNFSFEDASIQDIMRQVARWYDISVIYQGQIPVKKLTGNISRNVNASTLFSMLSYTGINFRIEGKKVFVVN